MTSADLGAALALIAQPFILLERLEDRLTFILDQLKRQGRIYDEQITDATSATRRELAIGIDGLTLGEKIGLVTSIDTWEHVTKTFDRRAIVTSLERAASLRNRLMHFRQLTNVQTQTLSSLPHLVDTIVQIANTISPSTEEHS